MNSHITRYRMHRRILACWPELIVGKDVLGINGLGVYRDLLGPDCQVTETQYPDVDLLALPYLEGEFDLVTCEQTIEHVRDPFQAVREIHRVLRDDGRAIITTVAAFPYHGEANFGDFWRFTHEGLRLLCSPFREIVQLETWGGVQAMARIFSSDSARRREKVTEHNMVEAMRDDKKYPAVVWAVVRK